MSKRKRRNTTDFSKFLDKLVKTLKLKKGIDEYVVKESDYQIMIDDYPVEKKQNKKKVNVNNEEKN